MLSGMFFCDIIIDNKIYVIMDIFVYITLVDDKI